MPTFPEVIQWIKDNWAVLKSAPLPFIVLMISGAVTGYLVAAWYYSGQLESRAAVLEEKDHQLGRYRVALGIDKASEGALVELNNAEMRAKTATTSARLRELDASYRRRSKPMEANGAQTSEEKKIAFDRNLALMAEVSDEFQRKLRADAINVDTELRRRLGPKALGSIVGLPPTFYSASDGAPIGILGLVSSVTTGMDAAFIGVLANGIDQMAQLLPGDK
jgi:hypothetical protein